MGERIHIQLLRNEVIFDSLEDIIGEFNGEEKEENKEEKNVEEEE